MDRKYSTSLLYLLLLGLTLCPLIIYFISDLFMGPMLDSNSKFLFFVVWIFAFFVVPLWAITISLGFIFCFIMSFFLDDLRFKIVTFIPAMLGAYLLAVLFIPYFPGNETFTRNLAMGRYWKFVWIYWIYLALIVILILEWFFYRRRK